MFGGASLFISQPFVIGEKIKVRNNIVISTPTKVMHGSIFEVEMPNSIISGRNMDT